MRKEKDKLRQTPSCPIGTLYTIRAGDTFFSLSQRFDVALSALRAVNPGVDENRLRVGQRICIPAPIPTTPPCPIGNLYTIRAGDTFFGLSQRFDVPLSALRAANPGVDENSLRIGQRICIPAPIPTEPPCPIGNFYTIRAGDTFFSLSQRFDVPLSALRAANPGVDENRLRVGQRICIPAPIPPQS